MLQTEIIACGVRYVINDAILCLASAPHDRKLHIHQTSFTDSELLNGFIFSFYH